MKEKEEIKRQFDQMSNIKRIIKKSSKKKRNNKNQPKRPTNQRFKNTAKKEKDTGKILGKNNVEMK